jgi:hypothetical protein
MKTKDIFDFNRFGKYFASDLKTCGANYGLSLLALTVLAPVATELVFAGFSLLLDLSWHGAGLGLRVSVFATAMFCMIVTMPVKCYGQLTDKQYGAFWLMLPASRLEKFISMLLICSIIVPALGLGMYLGVDALICAIDHTCNQSIVASAFDLMDEITTLKMNMGGVEVDVPKESIMAVENGSRFIRQITNPWLYVDEILCVSLPFLLGAICFKTRKTVMTFLAMAAFSMALSMFATPLMLSVMDKFTMAASEEDAMRMMFESGFYNNLIWLDIVSDTLLYGGIIAGIWFRIKTLKH